MTEQNSSRETSRSAWNINGQYAQIIVRRLAIAQGLYDKNNLVKYFKMLDSIFGLTTHNLEEEEIKAMNELRMKVLLKQKYFTKGSDDGTTKTLTDEDKKGKWEYAQNIRTYQAALLKVLKKCGFLTNMSNRARLDF